MTVKLTVDQLLVALSHISTIIRERRPMPQRGKLAFAKMHTALTPTFNIYSKERDDLIASYDYHPMVPRPAKPTDSEEDIAKGFVLEPHKEFAVPEDKMADFEAKWKPIGDKIIDLDVKPISVKLFNMGDMVDGSIEANEIIEMGDLISE